MKKCEPIAYSPSLIYDALDPTVRLPPIQMVGDDVYRWPTYVPYYVEKYDMALPQEFVDHVLRKIGAE